MFSLKKRDEGFTIVELLIVIVIIAILATLILVGIGGKDKAARDAKRSDSIAKISEALEVYYVNGGTNHYPSYADVTGSGWSATNLKLKDEIWVDPSGPTLGGAVTLATSLVNGATATATKYAYGPTQLDGSSCEADDTLCKKYTLAAKYEGTLNGATGRSETSAAN